MDDSQRITAIAVIVALANQKVPLSPERQTELKSLLNAQPLNFGTLHNFGAQYPLKAIYFQARQWLQSQASERGKGDLPIPEKTDDADTSLQINYITQLDEKKNTELEEVLQKIAQAEDAIAAANACMVTLTMAGSPGNLWSWIKRNLFTRR
ncbi:hypothetical protein PMG71_22895 [Roseofilum sp. BLCC_M154]|uniref:Uncharacterized protein n=1 Tax=Roseofilum acuticapitatum BLCC-M154 TaxID=3022444 RepID=A0ABT7B161_9CYAN|nr:hypothetical protein [Roseofilum acuticapitatum]MDJ1172281.1 hypothetical protein [Roseofilum acuticapitatum BLCC-M154]